MANACNSHKNVVAHPVADDSVRAQANLYVCHTHNVHTHFEYSLSLNAMMQHGYFFSTELEFGQMFLVP